MKIQLSLWLYKRLLRLYPRSYRQEFGEPMTDTFADLCYEAQKLGTLMAFVGLWWQVMGDLAKSSLYEHIHLDMERNGMTKQAFFWWVVASTAGWVLGWSVGYPFDEPTLLPLGGILVSLLHVGVLQRWVFPAGWYKSALPLHLTGWLLAAIAMTIPSWGILSESALEGLTFLILFSACLITGFLQWLTFRPYLHKAKLWIIAPLIIFILSISLASSSNSFAVTNLANYISSGTLSWPTVHFTTFILFGILYGISTGGVLLMLTPNQKPSDWDIEELATP